MRIIPSSSHTLNWEARSKQPTQLRSVLFARAPASRGPEAGLGNLWDACQHPNPISGCSAPASASDPITVSRATSPPFSLFSLFFLFTPCVMGSLTLNRALGELILRFPSHGCNNLSYTSLRAPDRDIQLSSSGAWPGKGHSLDKASIAWDGSGREGEGEGVVSHGRQWVPHTGSMFCNQDVGRTKSGEPRGHSLGMRSVGEKDQRVKSSCRVWAERVGLLGKPHNSEEGRWDWKDGKERKRYLRNGFM